MAPVNPKTPERGDVAAGTAIVQRFWIPCALVFLEFIGFVAGHMLWPWFGRGKDPVREIGYANAATLILTCILAFRFKRRFTRFRLFDAHFAVASGFISSLIGIVCGLHDGYGRHMQLSHSVFGDGQVC